MEEGNIKIENKTKIIDVIKETLSLDTIARPVIARLKDRIKKIQELSSAKSTKLPMGNTYVWDTIPPKMFISALKSSYSNGIGTITYQAYALDKEGNKLLKVNKATLPSGREIDASAEYVIEKMVVETIQLNRAIKVEEVKFDGGKPRSNTTTS